jgi:hypothetical protein
MSTSILRDQLLKLNRKGLAGPFTVKSGQGELTGIHCKILKGEDLLLMQLQAQLETEVADNASKEEKDKASAEQMKLHRNLMIQKCIVDQFSTPVFDEGQVDLIAEMLDGNLYGQLVKITQDVNNVMDYGKTSPKADAVTPDSTSS